MNAQKQVVASPVQNRYAEMESAVLGKRVIPAIRIVNALRDIHAFLTIPVQMRLVVPRDTVVTEHAIHGRNATPAMTVNALQDGNATLLMRKQTIRAVSIRVPSAVTVSVKAVRSVHAQIVNVLLDMYVIQEIQRQMNTDVSQKSPTGTMIEFQIQRTIVQTTIIQSSLIWIMTG